MPRRILIFFTSELKGVVQSAFLLAFAGFVAEILALLCDRLLAVEFWASCSPDFSLSFFWAFWDSLGRCDRRLASFFNSDSDSSFSGLFFKAEIARNFQRYYKVA